MNGMQMAPLDARDVLGWSIVCIGAALTVFALCAAVKVSILPGERDCDHPKYSILRGDR